MSTIAEITDVSFATLDDTQNTSRSLRPRKKKSASSRPVKKSKRIAKQRVTNLNQSLENKKVILIQETPSPITSDSTIVKDQQSTVVNETISVISPINHPVQPHVASIIKQLAKSSHKPTNKSVSTPVNNLDDVKVSLFGKIPDAPSSSRYVIQQFFESEHIFGWMNQNFLYKLLF